MKYKIISLLLLFFIFGCASQVNDSAQIKNPDIVSIEEIEQLESVGEKLIKQYQPVREEYPLGTVQYSEWANNGEGGKIETRVIKQFYVKDTMKNLCPLPEDFWKYKYMMNTGKITQQQLGALDECYYTQPEWYGDDFINVAIKKYQNPDLDHWTPEGLGNFPQETILFANPGEIHDVYSFFGASWIVEQYQGVGLKETYPVSVRTADGKYVQVDVEKSREYIDVEISPDNVLLAPAYVMFQAESDGNNEIDTCKDMDAPCWRKKIRVRVTIADDTPSGVYSAGFDISPVDGYYKAKWTDLYKEKYSSGSLLIKPSQEMFKLTIVVS